MSGASEKNEDGVPAPRGGPAPATPMPGMQHAQQAALLLQPILDELHKDIREIRSQGRTDFWAMLSGFVGGFLILAGMVIGAYFLLKGDIDRVATRLETRLDKQADQLQAISSTLSRVDQKLEDLTKPPSPLPRRP